MQDNNDRLAGGVLVLGAALTVLMMAHHPSNAHDGAMGRFVHGAMIALVAATAYGFAHVALRRGIRRPTVLAGMIAYGIAMFGHIGAATINGFAVTALAAREGVEHGLFHVTWELNQAFAQLGVVATGVAFLLWSLGWVKQRGWARPLGVLGIVAGLAPMALLFGGALKMNLAGAMLVYSLQAAWILLTGLYVWSGKFAKEASL